MDQKNASKQVIKSNRVKSFFLQAAKDIIVSEGVGSVSVRKIADITGYSYATIYHYYNDLNELLLDVKAVMIQDLTDYMISNVAEESDIMQRIKDQNRIFLDYFLERPYVFKFFYSYRLDVSDSHNQKNTDINDSHQEIYLHFVEKGILKKEEVPIVAKTIIYATYGMLVLYFSNNWLSKEKLYNDIDNMVDFMLKGR